VSTALLIVSKGSSPGSGGTTWGIIFREEKLISNSNIENLKILGFIGMDVYKLEKHLKVKKAAVMNYLKI
jgi:hypothetical protein